MSKITGVTGKDAGFSVEFPNGIDAEPDFKIYGLKIDCEDGDLFYSSMEACANWILDHAEELKSRKQYEFNVVDLIDDDGVANCTISSGEIIKD